VAVARELVAGQRAELIVVDAYSGERRGVYTSESTLFEAPNWSPDGHWLLVNADGGLFRVAADAPAAGDLEPIDLGGVPPINNDHVLSPDGRHVYVSANDGHLYEVELATATSRRITEDLDPDRAFRHYLHGISPDGGTLALVGTERAGTDDAALRRLFTVPVAGGPLTLVANGFSPADGPEYSPDGGYLYFNSEVASTAAGHAQLFRTRPDGSAPIQLTHDDRVNWFPHPSPDHRLLAYLSFPPGTEGHPENRPVILRLLDPTTPEAPPRDLIHLHGGQGTINVGSWSPDSTHLAYVAYPTDTAPA
jgi:Tol biopolymer transport system component